MKQRTMFGEDEENVKKVPRPKRSAKPKGYKREPQTRRDAHKAP